MWWIRKDNILQQDQEERVKETGQQKRERHEEPEDDSKSEITDEEYFRAVLDPDLTDAEIVTESDEEAEHLEAKLERSTRHYNSIEQGNRGIPMRQMTIAETLNPRANTTATAPTQTKEQKKWSGGSTTTNKTKNNEDKQTGRAQNSQTEISIMEKAEISERDAAEWASIKSKRKAMQRLRDNKKETELTKCECEACEKEATACKTFVNDIGMTIFEMVCDDCKGATCECECEGCKKRDTHHKEATMEMNRMKLEEDKEDDFDMTKPEQHQQAGEEHEASNEQRKNETQDRIMTHINNCCWMTRKVRETNINTNDFDMPAEQKDRRKKAKLTKKKQERHKETWIDDKRQTTIEHLQNRIMTADWEPARISNDSSYNSEEADEEDEKRHNAKDLHAQLKRAKENIDKNIREGRKKKQENCVTL
jgi:hypothetical protein